MTKLIAKSNIEIMIIIACPANCKTCKTGGATDGGKPVNSEGICEYFCSPGGYCGYGPYYKSGVDCNSCSQGNFLINH